MPLLRRHFLLLPVIPLTSCIHQRRHDATLDAPNVVSIHGRLVTAGQPSEKGLARLSELGYESVVYLAPWSVPDAIHNEPDIIRQQGMEFAHIPVVFERPTEQNFRDLSDFLLTREDKKVLVHCQINLRASTLVFLHRTITKGESPELAYQAVSRVWSPHGPWQSLANSLLRKSGVSFEVF